VADQFGKRMRPVHWRELLNDATIRELRRLIVTGIVLSSGIEARSIEHPDAEESGGLGINRNNRLMRTPAVEIATCDRPIYQVG
jgi:hypothetical protein